MEEEENVLFHQMGLDNRILKAISVMKWEKPTSVQEKAIPLALSGKDILSRARTGSGKTGAYVIPMIQLILNQKQVAREQNVYALVLTPTRELCGQVIRIINDVTSYCSREVRSIDVSGKVPLNIQKPLLSENPDVVVGTPSRILAHLAAGNINLKMSLQILVIDEADLIFSFGYEENLKSILEYLPSIYQAFLMSATLSEDVKSMKKMILHNPVVLKLEETQLPEANQLAQYYLKCEEEDKFVLMYTLLKLRLISGKSIIFVNTVNKCYRLKLFFEQFSIRSCVINSELPVTSRCHIVSQFNDGLYDIIVAADEVVLFDPTQVKHSNKKRNQDKEAGVSRGIDFQFVSNVINFDFPSNFESYIHRVGRTARGDNQGSALSFVSAKENDMFQSVEEELNIQHGSDGNCLKPFLFRMEELDGFRYRAKDAMRSVTKVAVREARLTEIKRELLNSQKLKPYFEDNPRDLQLLRHDKNLHVCKIQEHLRNVPDYLIPRALKQDKLHKLNYRSQKGNFKRGLTKGQLKHKRNKADPLKSFEFHGINKKKKKK